MAREINLVPDIKGEMIKALKLRNFIFFVCIVVAAASVGVILLFATIAGGQQAVADGKKATIENLSKKLNSYDDLSDFLTVRDQLNNLSAISKNKKLLSRTFSILSAILPKGEDSITFSELTVDLASAEPSISFDAQADAGGEQDIDYNVLEAFKKSMDYMRYDYGSYVDKDDNEIPAYCMVESGNDGATLSDPEKGIYAYWLIAEDGCNPGYEENILDEGEDEDEDEDEDSYTGLFDTMSAEEFKLRTAGYETEEYDGQTVVKIWRTPQFNTWYKSNGDGYMDLDGSISGIPHFESQCTTYTGTENESNGSVSWTTTNNVCYLVPDGVDGIKISDSSNGRDAEEKLVLRFSATIRFAPEVYKFSNHHVLAVGPTGRFNVTDSYVQIQDMFAQKASDCAEGDTSCSDNKKNKGGE